MKLEEFIQSEIATTNTTIFDSGWCKTEQVAKATGSSEVKVTSCVCQCARYHLSTLLTHIVTRCILHSIVLYNTLTKGLRD